jgi:hypothetical protein
MDSLLMQGQLQQPHHDWHFYIIYILLKRSNASLIRSKPTWFKMIGHQILYDCCATNNRQCGTIKCSTTATAPLGGRRRSPSSLARWIVLHRYSAHLPVKQRKANCAQSGTLSKVHSFKITYVCKYIWFIRITTRPVYYLTRAFRDIIP